jgi:hypothetical protein
LFFSRESQSFGILYFFDSFAKDKKQTEARMTLKEFSSTINEPAPPKGTDVFLQALWYDAKGDWNRAHHLIQDEENATGAWIHAYLHRKEGDLSNAGYWYRKANRKIPNASIQQEWEEMAEEFLKRI